MSKCRTRQQRNAEEEVAFWRKFIHWWETTHDKPATDRMHEALRLAERRLALACGADVPPAEMTERTARTSRFH